MLGAKVLLPSTRKLLLFLLVWSQMIILKRNLHGETTLNPEECGWLHAPVPPGDATQTESNSLWNTDVAMVHGIFLLVTQTHPDNLSTRYPTKHILSLKIISTVTLFLNSKLTISIAKQIKLPTGKFTTFITHLQCTTMAALLLPFRSQLGSGSRHEQVSTSAGRVSGGWRQCLMLALSLPAPALEFATILILPVLQGLVSMSRVPLWLTPPPPSLGPWALMKLIQEVNFYQSKRFAIFICKTKGGQSKPFMKKKFGLPQDVSRCPHTKFLLYLHTWSIGSKGCIHFITWH